MSPDFVDAGVPDITLEEILAIKHPSPAAWSPDGSRLAWLWNDGGLTHLWCAPVETGEPTQLSQSDRSVEAFDWSSNGRIAYSQGGDLYIVRPGDEPQQITQGGGKDTEPRWSPDGLKLAFSRDGALWIDDFDAGRLSVVPLPGPLIALYADGTSIKWSPGGSRLALCFVAGGVRDLAVVSPEGQLLWRTRNPETPAGYAWVGEERLHYTAVDPQTTVREQRLVEIHTGEERILLREESTRGLKEELDPIVLPGREAIVYLLTVDGWPHLFHVNLISGEKRQLTGGACEDVGHDSDALGCSPDGRSVVFSSNRETALNQRRLWIVEAESGEIRQLTSGPGTDCDPRWSPDGRRIAFIHCGPHQSADLWVVRPDGTGLRQISHSMPASLTPSRITTPTHLTYPSEDGMAVQADIFLPKGFDPNRKYPAVVWIHGGISRQMRHGWHPSRAYAMFYSFHQYLLHQGYVVLSVDYRGSVGYGREYEEANYMSLCQGDLADVAAGATYLRSLGYVDPEAIAAYGLSYGGYLTLGAMTKHPDAFALGINIAGIWNWEQYANWRDRVTPGRRFCGMFQRLGGSRNSANAEAWDEASPGNFVAALKKPLLNLMGTADERVDFAQLDAIVRDCVKHQKDYAVMYYPGETHMFTHRSTWRDAFPRIERAFERYLKVPPEKRSKAMI